MKVDSKAKSKLGRLPRRKPPVADKTEAEARANLIAKVELLEAWANGKLPQFFFELEADRTNAEDAATTPFPTSLRQFNKWKVSTEQSQKLGLTIELKSNSQDTIKKQKILRERVETVLKLLKEKWDSRDKGPESTASKLKRQLKISNAKCGVLEIELCTLHERLNKLQEERDAAILELESLKSRFRTEADQLTRPSSRTTPKKLKANVLQFKDEQSS